MISCLHDPEDVVVGLEVGADDYLRKPFEVRELVAHVAPDWRRSLQLYPRGRWSWFHLYHFPGLTIDMGRHEVRRDGRTVALTPTEFKILVALARQAGAVVPRPQLIAEVWRNRDPYRVHSLDAHRTLSSAPQDRAAPRRTALTLHAVIGAGYRFEYQPPRGEMAKAGNAASGDCPATG